MCVWSWWWRDIYAMNERTVVKQELRSIKLHSSRFDIAFVWLYLLTLVRLFPISNFCWALRKNRGTITEWLIKLWFRSFYAITIVLVLWCTAEETFIIWKDRLEIFSVVCGFWINWVTLNEGSRWSSLGWVKCGIDQQLAANRHTY